jgi:hypothetical protein
MVPNLNDCEKPVTEINATAIIVRIFFIINVYVLQCKCEAILIHTKTENPKNLL